MVDEALPVLNFDAQSHQDGAVGSGGGGGGGGDVGATIPLTDPTTDIVEQLANKAMGVGDGIDADGACPPPADPGQPADANGTDDQDDAAAQAHAVDRASPLEHDAARRLSINRTSGVWTWYRGPLGIESLDENTTWDDT